MAFKNTFGALDDSFQTTPDEITSNEFDTETNSLSADMEVIGEDDKKKLKAPPPPPEDYTPSPQEWLDIEGRKLRIPKNHRPSRRH